MGFKGPWGTTYAANLRLRLADMDEAQWLDYSATLQTRPIMPDFAVRAMSAEDRRAIYRFDQVARARRASPRRPTCRRARSRNRRTTNWCCPPLRRRPPAAAAARPLNRRASRLTATR